jgi:hypothetical protein
MLRGGPIILRGGEVPMKLYGVLMINEGVFPLYKVQ